MPQCSRARVYSSAFKVMSSPFFEAVLFHTVNDYHMLNASGFGVAYAQRYIICHVRQFPLLVSLKEKTRSVERANAPEFSIHRKKWTLSASLFGSMFL